MKWLRTIVLVDKGGVISTPHWEQMHESLRPRHTEHR